MNFIGSYLIDAKTYCSKDVKSKTRCSGFASGTMALGYKLANAEYLFLSAENQQYWMAAEEKILARSITNGQNVYDCSFEDGKGRPSCISGYCCMGLTLPGGTTNVHEVC
jgi:hypothetical protein